MNEVADATGHQLLRRVALAQSSGRVPSLVAGVVRDGSLVWSGGYGAVPASVTDTAYRIGSITKTVTAVLVLQLVRDGRLGLDDPVGSVIGEVGYADRTARALLAHCSGMQSEPTGDWWERSAGVSWDELVARHDGSAAVFAPSDRFHYSNLGYALLGRVVEELRGQSWWHAARDLVLGPLGLDRTTYLPQEPAARGFSVHPYTDALADEPATDTGAMAPAGQLWSTIGDLATYAAFLLDGHPDVLSQTELVAASAPQSGDPDSLLGSAHALGFQLVPGGSGTLVGHSGSMPGFLAGCFVDRRRRTAAVTLANGTVGVASAELCRELVEELERCEPALPPPWRPSSPVPPPVADVLGVWHWGNTALVFAWEGEELVVRRAGTVLHRFAVDGTRIVGVSGYHAGEELHVVRDADGSVRHLDIATFIHTRRPYGR